ncbi:hypothetical protein [Methylobacterium sp. Leaf118]|uniref:hypothetical protein n=1 Tax=Methylobacterium sp. Leaf118 TaxID=2876562 RepID=UPI001E573971|nr:hypothetical protein [Methylobacterium sp. Leaf118]
MNDREREAQDIADELVRMLTRRLCEGAKAGTLIAGLSLGLSETRKSDPQGEMIVDLVRGILDQEFGPAKGPDHGR